MKDFGLTDLFQLLGQQQKTGILNLQEDKKVVQFLFDKGMIVGTAFPTETEEENVLAQRLIRGGVLTPEKWKKAWDQHREELVSIERILVESGMVRKEDLGAVLRLATFEALYGLFKWKGGIFRFETKKVSYDSEFVEPLQPEYLLLDVLRMVDEWPLLEERIPNFEMILQKINAMALLDVLTGTPWEKRRTFQMEVVYELVNGQRTIQEIIDLGFAGEFETCKNLIDLMDAGLIEPLPASPGRKWPKEIPVTKNLKDAVAYFAVGVLSLFLFFQLAVARWEDFPFSQVEKQGWLALKSPLRRVAGVKVMNAREIFFLEEDRYPNDIEEMVRKGILSREFRSQESEARSAKAE